MGPTKYYKRVWSFVDGQWKITLVEVEAKQL